MDDDVSLSDLSITVILFLIAVFLTPLFIIIRLAVKVCNKTWLAAVSVLYPEVEFVKTTTIRSLIDTPRNQGIVAVLLEINGPPNIEYVRRHVQEVVNRRTKTGELAFPRLRHCLVTKCGYYAWKRTNFEINNNLMIAPSTFRGRTLTELNLQEYVSDVVSKYLPSSTSPWQVVVIPAGENQHCILLRIHHVLLSEGLNIADLLPLIPPVRQAGVHELPSAFVNVFKKPRYILELKERLQEDLTNRWNEFIYNHDPFENPELFKRNQGISEFICLTLVTIMSVYKECRKGFPLVKNDVLSKLKYARNVFNRETLKREINFYTFIKACIMTLNPFNICVRVISFWINLLSLFIVLPRLAERELMAIHSCITLQYCGYPNTLTNFLYSYIPLFYKSSKEIAYNFGLLVKYPKLLLKLLLSDIETIPIIPPSGRKVVAWSEPVKTEYITQVAKSLNRNETEILLATASASIARYCNQAGLQHPEEVPITARNVNSNLMFLSGNNMKVEDWFNGQLCFQLPVLKSNDEIALVENLKRITDNLTATINQQPITYLLTLLQTKYGFITNSLPASFLRILLKYLSRRYTISVTEITSSYPNTKQKTIWGEEVTSAIYWRPPQANITISLCFNQYDDHIILGVMCDAQLMPNHPLLARDFPEYVRDVADLVGSFH
ncbi:uncharacterized protein LOC108735448 isoform X2 [Agrilus planipennis]|uniref:Uncharacterized protein LOC108735448 isoform X2 n=1 Tax=Agrilus planipennis TaxID=224129 RepID=A0A1W4WSB7_AGRPL|nr:uncharacterized protein LOC108735448 isoform X2 [Agrilus planipennis]